MPAATSTSSTVDVSCGSTKMTATRRRSTRSAGPALVTVDPSSGDAVVVTNSDDGARPTASGCMHGAQLQSSSKIGPSGGDCSFPSGLAATAVGALYAPTFDVCGGGCGPSVLGVQVLDRSVVLADASIDPASDVAETTATLNGAVNPERPGDLSL